MDLGLDLAHEGDGVEADQRRDQQVPDQQHLDQHPQHAQRRQRRDAEVDVLLKIKKKVSKMLRCSTLKYNFW